MAITIGKLSIIIGAGLVGSVLSKEGRISDVGNFCSGALKIISKHLQHGEDKNTSAGKQPSDSLLAQVNNLRHELQFLASSRSVTIVTGRRSGSGTYSVAAIVVVGVVGYGYIWWKGWKISDMMFVTKRGLSDASKAIGREVDGVSSDVGTTKRYLCSRIDRAETNLDENNAIIIANKNEVSSLSGELGEIQENADSLYNAVQHLESRLIQIDSNQDVGNKGVVLLCDFVNQNWEQRKNVELIQGSQSSSSRLTIEHQQNAADSRTISPLALEAPSPSSSTESPKVVHSSCVVSSAGLKDLHEVSNELKAWNSSRSSGLSNGIPTSQEPSSSTSSDSRFWSKLPGSNILMRARTFS